MLEIKNGRLDQYDAEPFEQQQFGKAGVERVKATPDLLSSYNLVHCILQIMTTMAMIYNLV